MVDLKEYLYGIFGTVIGGVVTSMYCIYFRIHTAYDLIVNHGNNLMR